MWTQRPFGIAPDLLPKDFMIVAEYGLIIAGYRGHPPDESDDAAPVPVEDCGFLIAGCALVLVSQWLPVYRIISPMLIAFRAINVSYD